MKKELVLDYVKSLTHLYGLVHKDKVVEIYNLQNEDMIDGEAIDSILEEGTKELRDNFVEISGDFIVAETILKYNNFNEQLNHRKGKPFYIPEKEELLKYNDETYFEINKEYSALKSYVANNIFDGDEFKAEMLSEDVQGICQYGFSVNSAFDVFNRRKVNFQSEKQVSEVTQLIMDLANNTRLWENNGHTPNEIFNKMERHKLRPLPNAGVPNLLGIPGGLTTGNKKIGRNDSCPCGSGKKYKKCCGQ
ncbi:MAG: SEC-C domain-containing protein [Dethiobacter sp.]|jgi:preprotein translocase subunit SecA|nr:SEC-C domain-containing protein [Dethiobacter sp.]